MNKKAIDRSFVVAMLNTIIREALRLDDFFALMPEPLVSVYPAADK